MVEYLFGEEILLKTVALAGRRIDLSGSRPARFPISHVDAVRDQIDHFFDRHHFDQVVCSAACGSDLIALEIAANRNISFRIVLPFAIETFRRTSVTDRPGSWDSIFDRVISIAENSSSLLLLAGDSSEKFAYLNANKAIIENAFELAKPDIPRALLIWDGISRGDDDYTEHFKKLAFAASMGIDYISTLPA